MRLLDRLTARYAPQADDIRGRGTGFFGETSASGAAVLVPLGDTSGTREGPSRALTGETHQALLGNGVVFAVIQARAMLFAQARFAFRDKTDGSLTNLPPRARILDVPWPNASTGELLARMDQDVSLAGNAYIWKAEDDLLVRLPPEEVTIVSEVRVASNGNRYKVPIGYAWDPASPNYPPGQTGSGLVKLRPQFFTVDEVAHWSPYPDPDALFRGMSWLTPVLKEVHADNGFTSYKTQYLAHGQPVTVVKYAQKFRPDTVDSIVERIQAKYGGVANAFKPLVLDQGADPIIGAGLKDLDMAAIQAIGEERICAAGGVKPELLGLREAGVEQYQPAMRHLGDLTCRHLWITVCTALAQLVTIPSGDELWFNTADIAALQAAETEKAQVVQVSAAAVLTFVQAGFTRESIVAAVTTGDLSLLKPDPNAPTPGVNERETVTVADPGAPVTGPGSGESTGVSAEPGGHVAGANGKTGVPPGGGQTPTKPQTGASKIPMPGSIPTPMAASTANGRG